MRDACAALFLFGEITLWVLLIGNGVKPQAANLCRRLSPELRRAFAFFIFPLVVSATFAFIGLLPSLSQTVERCLLINSSTSADVLKSVSSCLTNSPEPKSVCVTKHVEKNCKYSQAALKVLCATIIKNYVQQLPKVIVVHNLLILVL